MIILHIDVNSAYLSWSAAEMLKNGKKLDIRTIASAVGGDPNQRHGIILAKSIPAKKYGIETGEPIYTALKKCPHLYLVPPDFEIYEDYHNRFISLLKKYFSDIEVYSIDECFVDYTKHQHMYKDVVNFANYIKEEIKDKLGFTVNIGIGENKVTAKMASDFLKPDRVHTLFAHEIKEKMWPLPIGDLFMVGRRVRKKLNSLGFKTIYDIANSDCQTLINLYGKNGKTLWEYSNGIDFSKLELCHFLKSIGNSETVCEDIYTRSDAHRQILKLSEKLGKRLRSHGYYASLIHVYIRYYNFEGISKQTKLIFAINTTIQIYENAKLVFDIIWKGEPLRNIGISLGSLSTYPNEQLSFFEKSNIFKHMKVDEVVDNLKEKYSSDTIKRCSLIPLCTNEQNKLHLNRFM